MPRKKKPVDRAPICDPAYLRRIDPVWMPGRVPRRFWEERTHRRDYLLWVGHRFGFRSMEDFYRLELSACYSPGNCGRGLKLYWGNSAVEALRDCMPQYDWKPWLFKMVPKGFWDSAVNRRRYMAWLGERLGYHRMDDWYGLTLDDFLQNRGNGLMVHYHRSPLSAVIALVPGRNWCEWKFHHLPPGFWEVTENRRRYLRWLGKDLGFRRREDWYRIRSNDIKGRHGKMLLNRYSSLYDLMREFLPRLDWDRIDRRRPLQVEEVLGWADGYHTRYGKWPTCESGEIPGTTRTWNAIDRRLRYGCRGRPSEVSLAKFLAKHRGVRVGRTPPSLSEKQILVWADVHFAARGKWPTIRSGPIPGTRETWLAVNHALQAGGRGLRRGSSLAQLLAQRRGARNIQRLPRLKEQQILAWADAHFAAYGKWPTARSGPISGTGETWCAVATALWAGGRGLRGGSSLPQLLSKRRGVRNRKCPPSLTERQILAWAVAAFEAKGRWPIVCSAPVAESPGDTWSALDNALQKGCRGLPGGSSLAKLLRRHGLK